MIITKYQVQENKWEKYSRGETIGDNMYFHYKNSPQGVKYPIETIRMFHQLDIMTGTLTT